MTAMRMQPQCHVMQYSAAAFDRLLFNHLYFVTLADFRKNNGDSTTTSEAETEEEVPEILFQGWLQKKAGATSKGKGKNTLKKAAAGWDKRWFEGRSRNGGQFAATTFNGASVSARKPIPMTIDLRIIMMCSQLVSCIAGTLAN